MYRQQAIAAIEAAGYTASRSSTPETIYVTVSDDSGEETLAALRAALPGLEVDWTGNSDTDGDGETTSDVSVSGMTRLYELREEGYTFDTVEADSADEALDQCDPAATGDYDTSEGPCFTTIYAVNVDDDSDSDSRTYIIEQDEPECTESEHDWQSPVEIVGGIKENPGVWGHGGGVTIDEVCMHCGCRKHTDTWAQNPDDGTQGHTTIKYTPGHYSEELEAYRASEESE